MLPLLFCSENDGHKFFLKLAIIYQTTRHHIPEDQNPNTYHGENLRSHMRTHQFVIKVF